MKRYTYLLLIAYFCCIEISAQTSQRISGRIFSDAEGPLIMVNVTERDKNNRIIEAAVTDMDGNFSMVVKNTADRLEISYIGYKTQVIEIGSRTLFNVKMIDDTVLDEVVIKAKPRSNTNGLSILEREVSVATQKFEMSEMEGLSFASVDEALQGQIAGLDIVFNSGDLGSGTTMRLRGTSTINGNAEPLIVVNDNIWEIPDGEEFDFTEANEEKFAQLLTVNPEDIESIEVLKDASASAIWGSRGANGVIKIKTKRGSRGKTKVTYNYRFTDSWVPSTLSLLNGDDYTMLLKESHFNPTQSSTASNADELSYNPNFSEYENYNNNTDWTDAVSQHGYTHDHNISLTGGGEKATFRISGGYYTQTGSIIKQTLDRFSTRMALDYYVSDRIKVSTDFSLTYTDNNQNYSGLLGTAQLIMPNMSIYAQDPLTGLNTQDYYIMLQSAASIFDGNQKGYINPVAVGDDAWNNVKTYTIAPQIQLDYNLLGLNDDETQLKYSGLVYMNANTYTTSNYYSRELTTMGWSDGNVNKTSLYDSKSLAFTTRHTLTFTPHFKNEDHYLTAMGRFELTSGSSNSQSASSYGLPSGNITSPTVGSYLSGSSTSTGQWRSVALIFSMHYSWKSKYSLDFTLRRDGSTKFGSKRRWGNFPGVSARWNISDEPFMNWSDKVLSMLSFRAGWGINGTQPGSEYLHYSTYSQNGKYMDVTAFSPGGMRLTDLRWEKKTEYNLGSDFGFFDDLITGKFEYYNKLTSDQLMGGYAIPSSTGYGSLAYKNTGSIRNKGWELNLNTSRIKVFKDFSVSFYVNVGQNFNTIEEMESSILESQNSDYDFANSSYLGRIQVDNPLGSIYGFRYKGVYRYSYKNWEKALSESAAGRNGSCPIAYDENGGVIYNADGTPKEMVFNYNTLDGTYTYAFSGGDAIYEDINHDGQINELDIVYLGNSNPKAQGGFGINFYYKRFQLKANFTYRYGVDVINSARMGLENMYTNNNQSIAVNWRWRKEGDITEIPRALYNTGYNFLGSDRYVEDASYIRLSYLQISYSFEPSWLKKYGLTNLNVYASANNLFFLTKYTGLDPEVSVGGWGRASDSSRTPRSKSYTLSLSVGF